MTSEHSTLFQRDRQAAGRAFFTFRRMVRYWQSAIGTLSRQVLNILHCRKAETIDEIMRLYGRQWRTEWWVMYRSEYFLSGGVDSSTNVALMAELMDRPIDTYSVGFKELEKYNEMEYARKVAGIFKTNHHEILIDDRDALPVLEELAWHEDEPNGDPVCIPLYFLSKSLPGSRVRQLYRLERKWRTVCRLSVDGKGAEIL